MTGFSPSASRARWSKKPLEDCPPVAAGHTNVYLECGLWWSELYERALSDSNIGLDKLLWAADWGHALPRQPGRCPPVYLCRSGARASSATRWATGVGA